ncbi:MAG: GNAT family N-acetyltransferase [Ruminococcaceae bacterium]|nr:GNAT family N-acetyltransferase [Oscillospiraceae bacterium]
MANAVIISEVKTKKDIKEFVEFPLKLYKGNPYFVPCIYSDEVKLIKRGGEPEIADSVFLLARRDGKVVGRIQGILQKQYNELHGEKRIRFTRFDSINDKEVSRALFSSLEEWGRSKGMNQLCGPLGYSDLDREGLLIFGFEEDQTFEEQYNYDYYPELVEDSGLLKEVDWLEFELRAPEKKNEMLSRVAARSLELNKLHVASTDMSKKDYIAKYKDGFFECLEECYAHLYGVVPFTERMKEELVEQFVLLIKKEFLIFICDENDRVVSFGLGFPNLGEALKKSGGRLTPGALIRLLKISAKPKTLDLGLIAVRPEYQNSGLNAVLMNIILEKLHSGEVRKLETNLNLETNEAVMAQWKLFNARQHKRRRSYLKSI